MTVPIFVVGMWLLISFILSALSGWFALARRYPDRPEAPLRTLHSLSGSMAFGVRMNGILRLSPCPSGLRVGLFFLFAAFSRDFLVPWREISVSRSGGGWFKSARLQFGNPVVGFLTISAVNADLLAQASEGRWPEPALGAVD